MNDRPLGVTLVAVIAWLSGLFQAIGAVFAIVFGLLITWPAIVGWFSLLVGIVTLVVGVGLWRGNAAARTVATIVFVISIGLAVIALLNGGGLWSAFWSGGLSVIGLILLYTREASRYFRA